ncbi:NUDIX hydrolase [Coprothermobacter platensis]|uniref:NUDIX hydrolase n=1 Tax=Coprothermobacter platensis TaxID=108819 RepID=UPI00037FA884|nr:NUDIX hydrolase [Coprothermobacter platensis]
MNLQRTLFKGNFLQVDIVNEKYEVVRRPHAVGALIYWTECDKLVFVKHYRPAIDKIILEIVAGLVEHDEDPSQAVRREIDEEVGLSVENLTSLGSFYPTPGYSDEVTHLFYAECSGSELNMNDPSENLEPVSLKIEDVWTTVLMDMKTSLALCLSKEKHLLKHFGNGSF